MKYGGTSVKDADAVRRVIAQVRRVRQDASERGDGAAGPVLVVSALSRVTDTLLEIAALAGQGRETGAQAALDALRQRHAAMLAALVSDPARGAAALAYVGRELDELQAIVHALAVLGELSPRSQDVIAATGELVSSSIVAAALHDAGVPAVWIDARRVVVTTGEHGAAQPLFEDTAARLAVHVAPALAAGQVPVLGGFVGATRDGVTTTLGRGGSDYSAAIVGACLGAAEIQIWTDVDGMLTADPRLVPGGRVVASLSFDEASELAYFGAKVLHPSTILPAMQRGIPVRILNSMRPSLPGTRIAAHLADDDRDLAAIACKRGVTKIDITSTRMLMAWGFLSRVFAVFEKHRTPVDVVTTSEVSVSVTIDDRRRLDEIVEALSTFADVQVQDDMAIVSVVGERLRTDAALGTRVIGALEGLPLEMVSRGGSRKNITVVVPDASAAVAMTRLHERFFSLPGVTTEATP
jgi:aspartate kinase